MDKNLQNYDKLKYRRENYNEIRNCRTSQCGEKVHCLIHLTKASAESANYPFCTIDPNVGIVPEVPDDRLKLLGDFYQSKKGDAGSREFVDIAGL